jgi:predicted metal-dependent HD superfamily phosphohydrolase
MPDETNKLLFRWRQITSGGRAQFEAIDTEFHGVMAAYGEPGRHYHDVRHLSALLALSDAHASHLSDRDAVDLAIFYHDAVYNPARADNEERSAALARDRLAHLGIDADLIEKIANYIVATKHAAVAIDPRETRSSNADLAYLLDFDLSVLAAEPGAYTDYAAGIRQEYAIYPDAAYRVGRAAVLRKFLALPRLYHVPQLAALWEARARANLERELTHLET